VARYSQKGILRTWFCPTVAAASGIPTATEVNAGTELTPELAEISGFTFANDPIKVPVMKDSFDAQIPGTDNTDASSMGFWEHKAPVTNPIKTALVKNTNGFVVIFYSGTAGAAAALGDKCENWPVTVSSVARRYTAANEAAMYTVTFAMTKPPTVDVAIT